jgi:ribose transport system substrate-binding protein
MRRITASVLTAALAITPFASGSAEELSLQGKTIGVTVVGTDHHWDLMACRETDSCEARTTTLQPR